jgi:hypothetical protein
VKLREQHYAPQPDIGNVPCYNAKVGVTEHYSVTVDVPPLDEGPARPVATDATTASPRDAGDGATSGSIAQGEAEDCARCILPGIGRRHTDVVSSIRIVPVTLYFMRRHEDEFAVFSAPRKPLPIYEPYLCRVAPSIIAA